MFHQTLFDVCLPTTTQSTPTMQYLHGVAFAEHVSLSSPVPSVCVGLGVFLFVENTWFFPSSYLQSPNYTLEYI